MTDLFSIRLYPRPLKEVGMREFLQILFQFFMSLFREFMGFPYAFMNPHDEYKDILIFMSLYSLLLP